MANAKPHQNVTANDTDPKRYGGFLQWCGQLMSQAGHGSGKKPRPGLARQKFPQEVASAQSPTLMQGEIDQLPARQKLVSARDFDVFYARAHQIPVILREIGRNREITFRAVGEGTGNKTDLDKHDEFFFHLFLWDRQTRQIAGAYRMGLSDEILSRYGKKGFYSHNCFKIRRRFYKSLGPSIELGRSFVCQQYQRNPATLSLLWKGIGRFVSQNPRYCTLFGPVSISDEYKALSKQLLVDFLTLTNKRDPFRKYVKPRSAFRSDAKTAWSKRELKKIDSFERISKLISTIEPDKKGAPVLIRQYLNMGGRILSFSVDVKFGNCLDGLMVIDLRETDPRALKRYMGPEGVEMFYRHHEDRKLAA